MLVGWVVLALAASSWSLLSVRAVVASTSIGSSSRFKYWNLTLAASSLSFLDSNLRASSSTAWRLRVPVQYLSQVFLLTNWSLIPRAKDLAR